VVSSQGGDMSQIANLIGKLGQENEVGSEVNARHSKMAGLVTTWPKLIIPINF
jgi:lysophospholipid acyltransferase (LPLAT)-like uncharacterized protein